MQGATVNHTERPRAKIYYWHIYAGCNFDRWCSKGLCREGDADGERAHCNLDLMISLQQTQIQAQLIL